MTLIYFVDLYELDRDAKQVRLATFKLKEEEYAVVEIDGDHTHPVLESIKNEGIFDYKFSRPGRLYPDDGMVFLENLKYCFRSGYLLATDVQKKIME